MEQQMLKDKVAVITGASYGMGRTMACTWPARWEEPSVGRSSRCAMALSCKQWL